MNAPHVIPPAPPAKKHKQYKTEVCLRLAMMAALKKEREVKPQPKKQVGKAGRPDAVTAAIRAELGKRYDLTIGDLVTFLKVNHGIKSTSRSINNLLNIMKKDGDVTLKEICGVGVWRLIGGK